MLWLMILGSLLFDCSSAFRIGRASGRGCPELSLYTHAFPLGKIEIPIDHFHNESRYEPHSNGTFSNRFWFDATYYKPGGPVIVENKGEDPYVYNVDLKIGLLHELAKATQGVAVMFEHRYYGSVPFRVKNLTDFRFLSVEQALADQAYFAQNVVFPGLEQYDLTAPNTPWFAIGGSYPGAVTAWVRKQYPHLFWGAIASSAVTAFWENYWGYYDSVRRYSPPACAEAFGKIVAIGDSILLSDNQTAAQEFKSLIQGANVNGSNANFADFYLTIPFSTQSITWIPCEQRYDGIKYCRILTSPMLLYKKADKFRNTIGRIVSESQFANDGDTLVTTMLNWIGWLNGYHKDNTTSTTSDIQATTDPTPPSQSYVYSEEWLAWSYQRCTELGLFQTGDAPKADTLPVISSLITLHYLKNMYCRNQLYENLTTIGNSVNPKLNAYGGFNISYPRLMFTGGEKDPWRPATQLADRADGLSRLNYSSTPSEPYYVIPGAGHINDLQGIFPNQTEPGVPPPGIKTVHRLEKEAFVRWLAEWHETHPDYNVYAQK